MQKEFRRSENAYNSDLDDVTGRRLDVLLSHPFANRIKKQVLRLRCAALRMTEWMGHGS